MKTKTFKIYNVRFYLQYQGGGKSGSEFFEVEAVNAGKAIDSMKKKARDECWFTRQDGSPRWSAVRISE